jgi:hypothetical protein
MAKVEFISYDGKYPNLCSGNLTLRIDGAVIRFAKYSSDGCEIMEENGIVRAQKIIGATPGRYQPGPGTYIKLESGGSVSFGKDWDEHVTDGPWGIDCSPDLEPYREEIKRLVNDNVDQGCCGGCV